MFKRYHRAQKWLEEQNPERRRKEAEPREDGLPSMEELRAEANEHIQLDKTDWPAMLVAAFFTILLPCLLILLVIAGVGMLIF